MIELSDVRVFLCTIPTKMTYSFDSLMGLAQQIFDEDPLSGHLFLFVNRQRDRLKILFWDHDGLAIFYKRLETEDTQIFGFTEAGRRAHNQPFGVAEAHQMVGVSRQSGPRRSVMSGQGSPIVPPRAQRQGRAFGSSNSGRS